MTSLKLVFIATDRLQVGVAKDVILIFGGQRHKLAGVQV